LAPINNCQTEVDADVGDGLSAPSTAGSGASSGEEGRGVDMWSAAEAGGAGMAGAEGGSVKDQGLAGWEMDTGGCTDGVEL
jgi:hypothetical protein